MVRSVTPLFLDSSADERSVGQTTAVKSHTDRKGKQKIAHKTTAEVFVEGKRKRAVESIDERSLTPDEISADERPSKKPKTSEMAKVRPPKCVIARPP
jgi:hypothetical protein